MMALELMASGKPVFYFDDTATQEVLSSSYPFAISNKELASIEAQRLVLRAEQVFSKVTFAKSMANLFKSTMDLYEK